MQSIRLSTPRYVVGGGAAKQRIRTRVWQERDVAAGVGRSRRRVQCVGDWHASHDSAGDAVPADSRAARCRDGDGSLSRRHRRGVRSAAGCCHGRCDGRRRRRQCHRCAASRAGDGSVDRRRAVVAGHGVAPRRHALWFPRTQRGAAARGRRRCRGASAEARAVPQHRRHAQSVPET